MKAIHGGQAKHDSIDAQKIAVLLRGGMLPQASVYPAKTRWAERERSAVPGSPSAVEAVRRQLHPLVHATLAGMSSARPSGLLIPFCAMRGDALTSRVPQDRQLVLPPQCQWRPTRLCDRDGAGRRC
jgi:hypothetical protein